MNEEQENCIRFLSGSFRQFIYSPRVASLRSVSATSVYGFETTLSIVLD